MKLLFLMAVLLTMPMVHAKPLQIVVGGKSDYSIYHDADAPSSVKTGATELQTYIAKATGVKLPITQVRPASFSITLGMKREGETFKPDEYRIDVRGVDLHIRGEDTPDGASSPDGGVSRGTLNGVYAFLDQIVGVRWLMPGELGDSVPKLKDLLVPEIAIIDSPDFASRQMPYIQNKDPLVQQWITRNRLGGSLSLSHGHNWDYFEPSVFDRSPEMFTLRSGRRVRPVSGRTAWICTTSPEAIAFLADNIVEEFRKNPKMAMASISPSDGVGQWCECERCVALDEKSTDGEVLHTRRIVTFYNEVTARVSKECPGKRVGGYIYLDYVEPPIDASLRFHPDFHPVIAPLFYYGPMAYRADRRGHFHRLIDDWAGRTGHMSFYGIPLFLQSPGRFSLPIPPGRKVLRDIMPTMKKSGMRGLYIYGTDGWGHGAAYNWVLARLMWKGDADVDALCHEFYVKSYGKAAEPMSRINALLEDQTEKYYVNDDQATYHLQPKAVKAVYAPVYWQIEELYKQALAAVDDEPSRKRLELYGFNLRGLCRVLQDYGWLEDAERSIFYMPENEFQAWAESQKKSLYVVPGSSISSGDEWAKVARTPLTAKAFHDPLQIAEPMKPFLVRFKNHFVLLAENETQVKLNLRVHKTAKGGEAAFKVYDSTGRVVLSGQTADERHASFIGAQGGVYHLITDSTLLSVEIAGAAWAIDGRFNAFTKPPKLHFTQGMTPAYLFVPRGTKKFDIGIATEAPGETCRATLYSPENKPVAEFSTVKSGAETRTIDSANTAGEFWKLVIEKAESGGLDDVWVELSSEVSRYVSLDPANRLVVEDVK